jgi:glycerol-3-phosphate acyltransferase PlsY
MNILLVLLAALVGYLAGSLSFTRVVSRIVAPDKDLDNVDLVVPGTDESFKVRHVGATTASIVLGPKVGCTVGILDMLKTFVPTLLFDLAYPGQPYFLITAVFGMVGHNWSIFNHFKGGRGISAAYGSLIVIDWVTAVLSGIGGTLIGLLAKDFFVTYLAGLLLVIPLLWLRTYDLAHLAFAILANVLFLVTLLPDLKQYLRLRRSGLVDADLALQATPMGRGMSKMLAFLKGARK